MIEGRKTVSRNSKEDEFGNLPEEWLWVLDGEKFLRERFKDSDLQFSAALGNDGVITLDVFRKSELNETLEHLFMIRESVKYFPSSLTVTKILMVL